MSKQCFREQAGRQEIPCKSVFKSEESPGELGAQLQWERHCPFYIKSCWIIKRIKCQSLIWCGVVGYDEILKG